MLTVAVKGEGVDDLIAALDRHHAVARATAATLEHAGGARLLERTREVVDRATRRWVWEETRAEQLISRAAGRGGAGAAESLRLAAEVLDGLKQGARI